MNFRTKLRNVALLGGLAALLLALQHGQLLAQEEPTHPASVHEQTHNGTSPEAKEGEHAVEKGDAVVITVTITSLVIMSILFELMTEILKETTDEMNMPFVNTIFSELTTLGFIGLVLFLITKLAILDEISRFFMADPHELRETIELLHMGLFLFIIIFLVLCCALLRLGVLVQNEWREFERAAMDIPSVVSEFVLATEPPTNWWEVFSIKRVLNATKCHREMVYLALRRRFMDPTSNHPNPETSMQQAKEFQLNTNLRFPFNEYLSIISGEAMGYLIDIDLATWIVLEVFLVTAMLLCWSLDARGEIIALCLFGLGLIGINKAVSIKVRKMRDLLLPPRMMKDAERLREKNEWRTKHQLPVLESSEKTSLLGNTTTDDDFLPPFHQQMQYEACGRTLTDEDARAAQKRLLWGWGDGAKMAVFSTRIVFLLTAMHLSAFLMRTRSDVNALYHESHLMVVVLYLLFLLPSIVVITMSVNIARDAIYVFHVEYMKNARVITKVMRILKARQTLRTLRFVAEMKIYLRETVERRRSSLFTTPSGGGTVAVVKPVKRSSHHHKSPKKHHHAPQHSGSHSPPLSPLAAYSSHRERRTDGYLLEAERREINTIFCLFDTDGSGAVSRREMESLLLAITHNIETDDLNRLMNELSTNENGEVPFESFYEWCHNRIHECRHSKEDLIEEVFKMVDMDGSGFITVDEFIAIFKALGQSLDHDDVRELVYEMDRNQDGKIDLEEFEKMLQKHEV